MLRCCLSLCGWLVLSSQVAAGILGMNQLEIDFTNPDKAAEQATWSDPEHLNCTSKGFGWDGDNKSSRDGWIETKPLAIGVSWRPTQTAHVRIKLGTNYQAVVSTGPGSKAFYLPSLYVRHSPDLVHWSDWQPLDLNEDPRESGAGLYTTRVGVPYRVSRAYHERLMEWSRREDVLWGSDEDAFCRSLVEQDPEYFAKQKPFVGYVQFLMESSFRGGQRLTRFNAEVQWAVSGISSIPKDPAAEKRHNGMGQWSFRTEATDEEPGK